MNCQSDADRPAGRIGPRICAFSRARASFVDDLKREGMLHAVVLRSPVAHGRIRAIDAVGRARHAGRACGHDRGGDRRGMPVIPLRLANLPEFKNYLQPVIATRQGALCRRAGGGGGRRDARRWPRTRWKRSKSISSGCRRCRTGMRRRATRPLLFEATGSNRAVRYIGDVRRCRCGLRQGRIHAHARPSAATA